MLLSLDEESYIVGNMGAEHPISWCQDFVGGARGVGLGHTDASYSDVAFHQRVLGGLKIAAGVVPSGCSATQSSNYEVVSLDDNTQNPTALDIAAAGTVFSIQRNDRLQQIDPVTQANEDGLLGVALDPASDGLHNRISRYTYNFGSKSASVSTEKTLLKVTTQRNTCCHAGGYSIPSGNLFAEADDNTGKPWWTPPSRLQRIGSLNQPRRSAITGWSRR